MTKELELETGKLYLVRRRFFDIKPTGTTMIAEGSIVMAVDKEHLLYQGRVVWMARYYRRYYLHEYLEQIAIS